MNVEQKESLKLDDITNLEQYGCRPGTIKLFADSGFKSIWQIKELMEQDKDHMLYEVRYCGYKRVTELEEAVLNYPEFPDWFEKPESLIKTEDTDEPDYNSEEESHPEEDVWFDKEEDDYDPLAEEEATQEEEKVEELEIVGPEVSEPEPLKKYTEKDLSDMLLNYIFDIFDDEGCSIGLIVGNEVEGNKDIVYGARSVFVKEHFMYPRFVELTDGIKVEGVSKEKFLETACEFTQAVDKVTDKYGNVYMWSRKRWSNSTDNFIKIFIPKAEEQLNRTFRYPKMSQSVHELLTSHQTSMPLSNYHSAPVRIPQPVVIPPKRQVASTLSKSVSTPSMQNVNLGASINHSACPFYVVPLRCGDYFDKKMLVFCIHTITNRLDFDASKLEDPETGFYEFDENNIESGKIQIDSKYEEYKEEIKRQVCAFLRG